MNTVTQEDERLIDRMPRWDSHKVVRAARIHHIEFAGRASGPRNSVAVHIIVDGTVVALDVPYEVFQRQRPDFGREDGAYLVIYEDGYISWSPGATFIKNHTPHQDEVRVGTNKQDAAPSIVASIGGYQMPTMPKLNPTERKPKIGDIVQVWSEAAEHVIHPLIVVEVTESPGRGWLVSGRTVDRSGYPGGQWLSLISTRDYRGLGQTRWRWPQ